MPEIQCAHCGANRDRPTGEVNRAAKHGRPLYCSRQCGNAARTTRKQPDKQWHKRRFEPREARNVAKVACVECGRPMWLPNSKIKLYVRCGPECVAAWRKREYEALLRECETCGVTFRPRPIQVANGAGRYCSHQCQPSSHLFTPEALAFAHQRRRENHAAGLIEWKKGPDHHSWKGGKEAARSRNRESGKSAARVRDYRKRNPHKIREFAQRRKGRKLGRLEYGSVPRIGALQKWRCAICRASIRKSYHVDHIVPLAKGGEHVAANIQLLCGPCNVRKSDRDPIVHMQSLGRLL